MVAISNVEDKKVHVMSAWLVKTQHSPSRRCRDSRVYGHTATGMHEMSAPPPPAHSAPRALLTNRSTVDLFLAAIVKHMPCVARKITPSGTKFRADVFQNKMVTHNVKRRLSERYCREISVDVSFAVCALPVAGKVRSQIRRRG